MRQASRVEQRLSTLRRMRMSATNVIMGEPSNVLHYRLLRCWSGCAGIWMDSPAMHKPGRCRFDEKAHRHNLQASTVAIICVIMYDRGTSTHAAILVVQLVVPAPWAG